jgi:glutathione synthase/RimK-type ligase-like ATP-grasp enzyme
VDAVCAGIPISNPLSCALSQSKAFHARLLAHAQGDNAPMCQRLLPPTRPLEDQATADEVIADQADLVLKPMHGRMGEGVVMGAECPAAEWHKRVAAALRERRTRPYVAQRRFRAVPVELPTGHATACVGVYVCGGRFAGYYSRLSAKPLVRYDAANVLTVVEGL